LTGSFGQIIQRSVSFENRTGLAHLASAAKRGDLDENGVLTSRDIFLCSLSWQSRPGLGPSQYNFLADRDSYTVQ